MGINSWLTLHYSNYSNDNILRSSVSVGQTRVDEHKAAVKKLKTVDSVITPDRFVSLLLSMSV